jgi:hypothetical protein
MANEETKKRGFRDLGNTEDTSGSGMDASDES